ncbi:Pentatricopeptide repeat-containing protein [Cynara cardunculus var. scolymus]|uniref:Pentatricopeptide repeat-containing protein n=1 Tax=Cynara cardunculus var. scolymus TaxID=59895 RepID=A0A118JVH5_CYNCS|nr:Pentatricopeptide repeat-containing protein [Cynara cardunculus var. scolymus]
MLLSSESLLQLLQRFIKNAIEIKQIHSLLITNGDLLSIPNPSTFKWTTTILYNTLIRAYLNVHLPHTTLLLFTHMISTTFVSVLSSCANSAVGGLLNGKQIHGYIIKNEDQVTAFTGTALITLYGKTGGLEYAMKVFKSMIKTKVCTWNAMIGALASNGKEKQAFEMFDKMNLGGWHPNAITFVVILAACARAKLIDFGFEVFYSMMPRFGILPRMEHYGCMVDLLGRAGFLAEARDFLKRMPFEPDATVLGALLGACKLHGDIELGDEVAKRLLELQPEKCGQYILLSSIYAEAEKWERASDLRNIMVGAGVEKPPAYSVVNAM